MAKDLELVFRDKGFSSKKYTIKYAKNNLTLSSITPVANAMIAGGVRVGENSVVGLEAFDYARYVETTYTPIDE